jgi:hypothetical protein
MRKATTVYFIGPEPDGPVKIGITTNMAVRFKSIQIHSPIPVVVYGIIDGGTDVEEGAHVRFHHLRRHYEWFTLDDELRRFIREESRPWVAPEERKRIRRNRLPGAATTTSFLCTPEYKTWVCDFADGLNLNLLGAIDVGIRLMAEDAGFPPPPDVGASRFISGMARDSTSSSFTVRPCPEWRAWLDEFAAFRDDGITRTLRKAISRLAESNDHPPPPYR